MPGTASEISGHVEPSCSAWRAVAREWLLPARTMERRLWPPALGLLYMAAVAVLGGFRSDHVVLGLLPLLDVYNQRTRLFLKVFLPFILTGVVYDGMRYFYWQGIEGRIRVAEPYLLERAWFGVGGKTLNEIFLEHHWPALDLVTGFAYLVYVAEFLLVATYLFFRGRPDRAATVARCFLTVNLMGFATYFIYPAAPPWYVAQYGLGPARTDIRPAAAAAHRFDALLGTHVFDEMYGRGVDVFGAFPSLHVAYPLMAVVLAFGVRELRWARWPAVAFFLLMCLSAVYLQHHYVIDVLLGVVYALAAVLLVSLWERRRSLAS